jgi:hypothetical protein
MAHTKVLSFSLACMFASLVACSAPADNAQDNAAMSNLGKGKSASGRLDNGRCGAYPFGCSQAVIDGLQSHCADVCNAAGASSRGVTYCYALNESGGTFNVDTSVSTDICNACDCDPPLPMPPSNCGAVTWAGVCNSSTEVTYCDSAILNVVQCDQGSACQVVNGDADCRPVN